MTARYMRDLDELVKWHEQMERTRVSNMLMLEDKIVRSEDVALTIEQREAARERARLQWEKSLREKIRQEEMNKITLDRLREEERQKLYQELGSVHGTLKRKRAEEVSYNWYVVSMELQSDRASEFAAFYARLHKMMMRVIWKDYTLAIYRCTEVGCICVRMVADVTDRSIPNLERSITSSMGGFAIKGSTLEVAATRNPSTMIVTQVRGVTTNDVGWQQAMGLAQIFTGGALRPASECVMLPLPCILTSNTAT